MGSVKIDSFEHNLKALEVKKKNGPTSGNCMPEHRSGGPRHGSASIL